MNISRSILLSTPCPVSMAQGRSTRLCWGPIGKGFWIHQLCIIIDVVQAQRHRTSNTWSARQKLNILCNFVSPFVVLDHILWILVIILQNQLRISQNLSKWTLNVKAQAYKQMLNCKCYKGGMRNISAFLSTFEEHLLSYELF